MVGEFLQQRFDKLSSARAICHPTRRRKMGRRRKGGKEEEKEKKREERLKWRVKGGRVLNKHLQLYFYERQRAHVLENGYIAGKFKRRLFSLIEFLKKNI